jgi:DNA primase
MITRESIQKLKDAIDVLAVVREYLPNLRRSGRNYFARCPFHGERTASFSVAPAKKLVHCFGCGYSGDAIRFVQDIEHIGYVEALEKLAGRFGVPLERDDVGQEHYNERKELLEALAGVACFYHELLLNDAAGAPARRYLAQRGITATTIERFGIGYAPDGNVLVRTYRHHDLSTLFKAGVVGFRQPEGERDERRKFDHPYDYFRGRVIIPVRDPSGRVVSFGGRILPELAAGRQRAPSYLNGPETAVFSKGNVLFGIHAAKDGIVREKAALLVEGYMDVMVLHQEGFDSAVAPLGTALSEAQAKLLHRMTDTVTLMFDADRAGIAAAVSAAQTVYRAGMYPQIAVLPANTDPDEYVLGAGREAMRALLGSAVSAVRFAAQSHAAAAGAPSAAVLPTAERMRLFAVVRDIVESIAHPVAREDAIRDAAAVLAVSEHSVRAELRRTARPETADARPAAQPQRPYGCEDELLWLCLQHPAAALEHVADEMLEHDQERLDMLRAIRNAYRTAGDVSQALEHLGPGARELATRMLFDERDLACAVEERVARLCADILRVRHRRRHRELKPAVDDMLAGRVPRDPEIIEEFTRIVAALKRGGG